MENSKVKFCGNCGAKMPETAQFCPKCGGKTPATPGQSVAQNGAATMAGASATPVTGQAGTVSGCATGSFSAQGASSFGGAGYSAQMQTTPQTGLGMNWYKFNIYFLLFAQALVAVITAINLFTGGHYAGYADYMYMFFGGLRVFDVIFALVFLASAAMAICVRQKLAHFKRDAPRLLYMFIVASNAATLVYVFGLSSFISPVVSTVSTVSSFLGLSSSYDAASMFSLLTGSMAIGMIVGCAILLAINVTYFKKRAHLFVN